MGGPFVSPFFADMTLGTFIDMAVERLSPLYPAQECKGLAVRLLKEMVDGYKGYEHLVDPQTELDHPGIVAALERLSVGEPLQYVLGYEWFCGHKFKVAPGVLIPRPETEELVRLISSEWSGGGGADGKRLHILDICTGSGCIAWSLASLIPDAAVYGCDISKEALEIASAQLVVNGEGNCANVEFFECDILSGGAEERIGGCSSHKKFDIIVSNPPYVCESERVLMRRNVLDYEPELALFVPDSDPLRFYRRIAQLSLNLLGPAGKLYFEINENYGAQTKELLEQLGYSDCRVINDLFGKERMVCAGKTATDTPRMKPYL